MLETQLSPVYNLFAMIVKLSHPLISACVLLAFFALVMAANEQFAGIDFSILPAFFLLSQSQSAIMALGADDLPESSVVPPPSGVIPRAQPERRAAPAWLRSRAAPGGAPSAGFVAVPACGLHETFRGARVIS